MADEEPGTALVPSLETDQEELATVGPDDEDQYKLAVGLISLWKVLGMTQTEAWRAMHPNDADLGDDAVKMRCSRAIKWFRERYELRWRDLLDMCNLGRFRILHEVEAALQATTWCRWRKKEVPDWRTRDGCQARHDDDERHHDTNRLPQGPGLDREAGSEGDRSGAAAGDARRVDEDGADG